MVYLLLYILHLYSHSHVAIRVSAVCSGLRHIDGMGFTDLVVRRKLPFAASEWQTVAAF
jgi:hypothetical protein